MLKGRENKSWFIYIKKEIYYYFLRIYIYFVCVFKVIFLLFGLVNVKIF